MAGKWVPLVQLECDHRMPFSVTPPLSVPTDYVWCETCEADVRLYAVECREWRARCHHCRFSRYYGQSNDNAREAQTTHTNKYGGHHVSVLYMLEPAHFVHLKKTYGRSVKNRITGKPNVAFPAMRNRDDGTIPF